MDGEVYVEEGLLDVLRETDLVSFERKLCVELQLSRLEHFEHITDEELNSYAGLSLPAIRRLRQTIAEKKKKTKKSKGIFSTIGKKESREVARVALAPSSVPPPNNSKDSTCLISKDQIKLMEKLGEGSFAVVKRGIWMRGEGQKVDVAVKILRDSSAEIIEDLQQEVNNMFNLMHPNLIRLYGLVFSNPAMMVVEFCDGGSLVDRLRSTDKPVLLVSTLLEYAQQIVKGMAYLESKHCVHRDLAARNVLLADSERTAKICDFGLMRALNDNERLYVMSAQKKIPFSWCPPESLRYRQFSHSSDVWAFGVTLWELFSYGEEPWAGLRGAEVLTKLEAGERLQRPLRCSAELFDLISTCWSSNANVRPRFSLLKGILKDIKFTIAECREPSAPNKDVDLELRVNDRVIVIEGSGVIWFGQNVRTKCFGRFLRSSIHVRSDRNAATTAPTSGVLSPMQANVGSERISKPVPGSFIHAGHGDINPGQSWGQPERIDDIYLKNPILRKDSELKENVPRQFGPQFVSSVIDMHSSSAPSSSSNLNRFSDDKPLPAKKPKQSSSSQPVRPPAPQLPSAEISSSAASTSDRSIDIFAPFSEYCDAFDEEPFDSSWNQPTSSRGTFYANPPLPNIPRNTYDQPPPAGRYDVYDNRFATLHRNDAVAKTTNGHYAPPTTSRPAPSNVSSTPAQNESHGSSRRAVSQSVPSTSSVSTTSAIPPPPVVSSLPRPAPSTNGGTSKNGPYASLPRPMRSSPDLASMNGNAVGRTPAGATPPPIRATNFIEQPSKTSNGVTLRTPMSAVTQPASAVPVSVPSTSSHEVSVPSNGSSFSSADSSSSQFRRTSMTSLVDVLPKTTSNFRASSYYASSAREALASKLQTPTATMNTSQATSVPASPNAVVQHKETVFDVTRIPPDADTIIAQMSSGENVHRAEPAVVSSAAAIPRVDPPPASSRQIPSSAYRNGGVTTTTTTAVSASMASSMTNGTASSAPASERNPPASSRVVEASAVIQSTYPYSSGASKFRADGPDPFEVSSSVKNLASRGRYSDVFSELNQQPSTAASTAQIPSTVAVSSSSATSMGMTPPVTAVSSKRSDSVAVNPSSVLPPPSALLLGSSQQQSQRSSTGVRASSTNAVASTSTSSLPRGTTLVLGQPIPNQLFIPPQQRNLTHRDSTPFLAGYSPAVYGYAGVPSSSSSYGYSPSMAAGNTVSNGLRVPYYWSGPSPTVSYPTNGLSASPLSNGSGTRAALIFDANLSNSPHVTSPRNISNGYPSTLSLGGSHNDVSRLGPSIVTNTRPRSTVVNEEILGLFDPLSSAGPSTSSSSGPAQSQRSSTAGDPVDAVLKDAAFAGRKKCAEMLQRCNNDVSKAVRELKTEELLTMGVASDRSRAITALEDCRWDLNAAASALLS